MKWFKHDSNANTDAKLKRVRLKYGMEGYGLYWYCLELIAAGVETHNITFELEHDAEIIAHDTGIHYERVQEMMLYFVDLKLFENEGGSITCTKMATRTDEYIGKVLRTMSGQSSEKVPPKRIEEKRREEKRHTAPKRGHEYPEDFEKTWNVYPRRKNNNPKRKAFHAWNARIREGHTPVEIADGVKRYANYVKAEGIDGTNFVKQASTFFGPDKPFLDAWKAGKSDDIMAGGF